ncbi:MAG: hypothetical protein ACKOET_07750, partial [Verrucomicrobiota bacterium]
GKTIPVRLPVVAPRTVQSTEIIPAAEVLERLATAQALNAELGRSVQLPPEIRVTGLEIQGIDFQFVEESEEDLGLAIPPIPALLVIPGNIGFLNQFFSVQVFTENGAPADSGLTVNTLRAELLLPAGTDRIPGTFEQPGDDPLRLARLGPERQVRPVRDVVQPGPDGVAGTADDLPRLRPGETGQAEFLVEGLAEGLHVLDLKLTADLEGLAAGVVKIQGRAAGSVLVRNPAFSLAFTHPRTVRTQEPYEASVTLLNTSGSPANFVSVTLPPAAVSGAVLETPAVVELGTIAPGESATARWRLRAQRTGRITFSNLTTGPGASAGQFRLAMGVDERDVQLSPDTLALAPETDALPEAIRRAAERVLGQALSAATAPVVPAGVRRVNRNLVRTRAVELAEAGQRVRLGEDLARVVPDLLLDWQAGRVFDGGFDQILRETEAGREWRAALMGALGAAGAVGAPAWLERAAGDLAGRAEAWTWLADSLGDAEREYVGEGGRLTLARSGVERGLGYAGLDGALLALPVESAGVVRWTLENTAAAGRLAWLRLGT